MLLNIAQGQMLSGRSKSKNLVHLISIKILGTPRHYLACNHSISCFILQKLLCESVVQNLQCCHGS